MAVLIAGSEEHVARRSQSINVRLSLGRASQLVGPLAFRRFFIGDSITSPFDADVVDHALRAARADLSG